MLIIFGLSRKCLSSGRSRSLYPSLRRAIKQTVVILEAYHCVNNVQNFIQLVAVEANSIFRGNCWGSSMWISTQKINYFIYSAFLKYVTKWEYYEAVHHLFTNFTKVHDSVRMEFLYNILTEFGIPMNLASLTKCV